MLDPKHISVSVEADSYRGTSAIRAKLQLTYREMTSGIGEEDVERIKSECQERIWHELYGDLDRKLNELRRRVVTALLPGAYFEADKAIREVEAMIRNPFATPAHRPLALPPAATGA